MRFLVVNDRELKEKAFCALCCEPVKERYVRDLELNIVYCSFVCLMSHILASEEILARKQ